MRSESALALPLLAFFAAAFLAPLCVLIGVSLFAEPEMKTLSAAQYMKFLGDAFNLSILWGTLWLGVKATLLCLLFGYPFAWIAARAPAPWQSALVFVVILPILTSVVVRTFWRVTVPLSLPGVVAGCILTYAACVTAFITQTLIGGARLIYMPLHIYQQAVGANNWPFAAAISVIFMVAVLIVVGLLNQVSRLSRGYAHG